MIYLDSCALVKLVRVEEGSAALRGWLDERADALQVTSELARAEVLRAVRRNNHSEDGELVDAGLLQAELEASAELLARLGQVAVDTDVLDRAGALAAPVVRTLDAIHLVTAAEWDPTDVQFVTYDRRLATAASAAGLTVVAPADPPGPST